MYVFPKESLCAAIHKIIPKALECNERILTVFARDCSVLSTKRHSQARDINMYNLFTEHSKPPSYIQSTFLPSASSRALTMVLPYTFFWRSLSQNVGVSGF
ncbi:hypothetical protein TNCV_1886051 [Trichonephila clavipes]|nr:hypothetical protein TNCV_1886051 [Trichonephila clavipes]